MRAAIACAAPAALLLVASCSHDLDKLRRGDERQGLRDAGSSGRGSAGEDRGGEGGDDGGSAGEDGGDSGAADSGDSRGSACEPCPDLSAVAQELGLRSCCRGLAGAECGLTFGENNPCLPREVPGQSDDVCGGLSAGGMRLDGCCRPDGRCGLEAAATGLGCVARDQILAGLGDSSADAIACRYECDSDEQCNVLAGGFVCAEHPVDGERFCADQCLRDQDCSADLGLICAFANDFGMDRVLAICRPAVGDNAPGSVCGSAEDCMHGVCVRVASGDPYCSELCRTGLDCPAGQRMCDPSSISRPSGTGSNLSFSICRK